MRNPAGNSNGKTRPSGHKFDQTPETQNHETQVLKRKCCKGSSLLLAMEEERSLSLLKLMANEGLMPSQEEEEKRKHVILELKKVAVAWAKKVAWQRGLPKDQIAGACARLLTYGSDGLGAHDSNSDIGALFVGPCFATMAEDFFVVLRNMLKAMPEVSEILCVKGAKVPLMRFKFNGISVDLPYVQFKVSDVPENVDILNSVSFNNSDETSWICLSGVRASRQILHLVPNLQLNGLLGGVHFAILVAYVCQNQPDASLGALILAFFSTFSSWAWPKPVVLQDGVSFADTDVHQSYMPICLPFSPLDDCNSNITKSTFYKIRAEFLRGHALSKDFLKPDFDWSSLFEAFPYTKHHNRFLKIQLSAPSHDELVDWVGWVKSCFRCLLLKLETMQGFCDPNPVEYVDIESSEPNIVFYWGLNPGRSNFVQVKCVEEDFMRNICNDYHGTCSKLKLSIVQASQLAKNALYQYHDGVNGKKMKACWKIPDYNNNQRIPLYSQHLPNYFVGFVVTPG